jgi:hypothetical protein
VEWRESKFGVVVFRVCHAILQVKNVILKKIVENIAFKSAFKKF